MALETKLYQKMTQQLVMTPQLRQAIKILQVSRTELETLIDEELTQNPVLEEGAEAKENGESPATSADPQFDGVVSTTTEAAPPEAAATETPRDLGEIDWKDYWENHENEFHSLRAAEAESEDDDRRPSFENVLTRTPELAEHLRWQLHLSDLSAHDQEIGEVIIGNLDVEGYLDTNVEEIANVLSTTPDEVAAVLRKLQEFDPPGVCARDLRECLLIQLVQLGAGDSLATRIVRDHLSTLESRRFEKLARDLAVTIEAVVDASKAIASLEPKPGRNYGDGEIRYVVPDVFVTKIGDEYVITLNDDGLPRLRLSYSYRRMLEGNPGVDVKNYLAEKKRAAEWLIKSIQQRQRTMYLVTQSIVKFQRDFFERGVSGLRPLVLRDVAGDIG
ncbi:MAG: RNA polymerase factor sigma-54, partial [Candidatus Binatia bacterium]